MKRKQWKKNDEALPYVVVVAQNGDAPAMEDLYERFEFFLLRFRSMLKSGKFDGHPALRRFLALYVEVRPDGSGRALRNSLLARNGKAGMHWRMMEAAKDLSASLREQLRSIEDTDIDSIIDVTFFQCVAQYDPKGKVRLEVSRNAYVTKAGDTGFTVKTFYKIKDVEEENKKVIENGGKPAAWTILDYDDMSKVMRDRSEVKFPEVGFHGFLFNYFHYLLRKNIDKEIRGVIPGTRWCSLWMDHALPEFDNSTADPDFAETEPVEQAAFSCVSDQHARSVDIDHEWIVGDTCQWPFDVLTSQERWLVKSRYYDRMFVCSIAEVLGISTSAIRNRLKIARDKLIAEGGPDLEKWLDHTYQPDDTEHNKEWYSSHNKPLARLWGFIVDERFSDEDEDE